MRGGGGRFISASAATESGLSMSAGASIRLNEPSGVKFQAVLPAAEYRAEDNYGFLIVPNDYFSKAGVVLGETTDYVKAFTKAYEEGKITKAPTVVENLTAQTRGELCYFEHSIVGILEQNYDREWFGVAFKKTGEGGTAEYAYAGFSDNIRSVQEVSSRALNKLVYHAEDLEKNSPEEFALLTSNKPILEEFVTTGIRNVLGGSALAYEISGPSAMYVNDCATLVLSVSSKVHIVSEWTSSAPEVVAVDPDTGELTALAAGTATIMAESSGLYSEAFEISVTAADESEKTIVKTAEWSENYRAEIDNTTVKEGVSSLKYTFINGMPVNPGSGIITSLRGRFLYLEEVTAVSGNDAFGLFGTETDWRNLYVGFYVKTNQALNLAVRWQNRSGGVWKGSAEMTFGGYVANKDIGPNADWQYVEFPLNGLFEDMHTQNVDAYRFALCSEIGGEQPVTFHIDGLKIFGKALMDASEVKVKSLTSLSGNYTSEINTDTAYVKAGNSSLKYTFTKGSTGQPAGSPARGRFLYIESEVGKADIFGLTSATDWSNLYVGFWFKQKAPLENDRWITLTGRLQTTQDGSVWSEGYGTDFGSYIKGVDKNLPNNTEWKRIEFKLSDLCPDMHTVGVTKYRFSLNTEIAGVETATFYIDELAIYAGSKTQ